MGNIAYIIKARVTLLRDLGPALSPFNSFLFLQGLETLHLRMPRHSENALAVAQYLERHPKVTWVNYPGLARQPGKRAGREVSPQRGGRHHRLRHQGRARGGKEIHQFAGADVASGQCRGCQDACHPSGHDDASAVVAEAEQLATGVTPDFIRLSVGLEHIDDILWDIGQALEQVK